jgi:hypothetical protein
MGFFRREPPTPAQLDAIAEAGRKEREAAAKNPVHLGQSVGLPRAAAEYILRLEARIEELERKVATLQGPPHVARLEKR